MELILIDWTRMGKGYCLAGAIHQAGEYHVVRPLLARPQPPGARPNLAWSPFVMDGHARWQVFEMAQPRPAAGLAPHREDVWVNALTARRVTAGREQRRAILQATAVAPGRPLFGEKLLGTATGAYLDPGHGDRSLVSLEVEAGQLRFTALWREGATRADFRVRLALPELGACILPVTDHFLLSQAERHAADTDGRIGHLAGAVRGMGPRVVVRLGLSRAFAAAEGQPGRCWVMANGFFAADDPQA